ncbi:hypothetical protein ACEWY4_019913 [Coilia grayii]|uniref:Uncharacterized protein n=1 Tax=Coilia grayii TaxID=363190 RepID=A0ABD1JB42_9TELE
MSVTVTKTEGVTVLTVTSDGRSNCPLLCQILGSLCYSPVCSVSQRLKENLGGRQTALGAIQIMIGLLNIGMGAVIFATQNFSYSFLSDSSASFWLGSLFIVFGVMCILAEKFPSPCLVGITGMTNVISAALAVTAIVVYAVDIATSAWDPDYRCDDEYPVPTKLPPETEKNIAICKRNTAALQVLGIGMDIIMIIFAALQLCVAISACVLAFKAACKKETAQQDPELSEPLVHETLSNPTV